MKRNLTIALMAIVFVIVVIAGCSMFLLEERAEDIPLKVGLFLTFNCTYEDSFSHNLSTYQITYEILAINGTFIDYKITEKGEHSILLAQLKYDTPFALKITPTEEGTEPIELVGNEKIELAWGTVSAEHYHFYSTGNPASAHHYDRFLYKNILVKEEFISGYDGKYVMILVDTNMPQLTELDSPP